MATNAPQKPSGVLVGSVIIYGIITLIAVWLGLEFKFGTNLKAHLLLAGLASIAMFVAMMNTDSLSDDRKKAAVVFGHLVLWAIILFVPFGEQPKIALGVLFALAIAEAGFMAGLDTATYKTKSNNSKTGIAKVATWVAIGLIAWATLALTGYDKKIVDFSKGFFAGITGERREGSVISTPEEAEEESTSTSIKAHVLNWHEPLKVVANGAFTTSAEGNVDLNNQGEDAVYVRIDLADSGDILLTGGTVDSADQNGGVITGPWEQEGGTSGDYKLTISNSSMRLVLKQNHANVGVIELK